MNTITEKSFSRKQVIEVVKNTTGILTLLILIILFYLINSSFLNRANVTNLLGNIATVLVMACGATLVRLCGSLDLSMGAVCSVSNVFFALALRKIGIGAYPLTMLFGLIAGILLGTVHAKLKMPSFIASLGFMNIWKSVALLITASPVSIPKSEQYLIKWGKISYGVISVSTIIALVIALLIHMFQTRTTIGRSLNYIGGNERSARIAGVNVTRYKIMAFTICGITSSICGIMVAAKLKSGLPTVGDPYTLQTVAAVLLGGNSASGGRGSVFKSLIGVMIVIVIHNGMTVSGVDAYWSQIIFGSLILLSMILATDRTRQGAVVK